MKERYTTEEKLRIVKEAQQPSINKTKLANAWNISRPTLNKWIDAYDQFGIDGLVNEKLGFNLVNEEEKDKRIRQLERQLKQKEQENEIWKKVASCNWGMKQKTKIIYDKCLFVKEHKKTFSITALTKIFNILKQTYYSWIKNNEPSYLIHFKYEPKLLKAIKNYFMKIKKNMEHQDY